MASFPGTIDQGSSDTGPSTKLWKNFPNYNAEGDSRGGWVHFEDYHILNADEYTATQAAAGTFALDTTVGNIGVALADCNSATATQGINVQYDGFQVAPAAGRKIGFETRCKIADTATGPELFIGLSIIDTTVIASSLNSSTDHIGYESVTDDNVLLFHTEDGSTRTSSTTPATMVEDTYIKLGFLVDGVGTNAITLFVDGVVVDTSFTTADICTASILVPTFVCQSGGTTDPILHLDWFKVGTYA